MSVPTTRDGYELVDGGLDPRLIGLSTDAAERLHDYLSQTFFPRLFKAFPSTDPVFSFDEKHVTQRFAASFGLRVSSGNEDNTSRFVAVRFTRYDNEWKLRAMRTSYRHDLTVNKRIVRYFVDVEDDLVLQSRVQARITSTDCDAMLEQFQNGNDDALIAPEKRAYERTFNARDCVRLQSILAAAANRRMHTDARALPIPLAH